MDEGWAYNIVQRGRIGETEFARHIPQIREAVDRQGESAVGEYLIRRTLQGLHLADALAEIGEWGRDASP